MLVFVIVFWFIFRLKLCGVEMLVSVLIVICVSSVILCVLLLVRLM